MMLRGENDMKTLIVYYSQAGGNTKQIAEMVQCEKTAL